MYTDHEKWAVYLDGVLLRHISNKISQATLQALLGEWKIYVEYDDINHVIHAHRYI
jgi:hypothetical protein